MKKKTKTAAIRHARKTISELYQFGGGYKFNVWDADKKAWWECGGGDYWRELNNRSHCLICAACDYMGMSDDDASGAAYDYANSGGAWTNYVPEVAEEVTV